MKYLPESKMADEMHESGSSSKSAENSDSRLEYDPKRLIGVEYPGLVQNPARMIETLGGEEAISKVFSRPGRRLPMTFRPDDPYSKIVCGDPQPSTNLLLRVRRRKKKDACEGSSDDGYEYKQEILGVIDKTYRFTSFADYQYLSKGDTEFPLDVIHGLDALDKDSSIHMLPSMFTRVESAANYHFKPDLQPHIIEEDKEPDRPGSVVTSKMRVRQPIYAFGVSFESQDVPQKPHEKVHQIVELVKDNQVEVIQKLFNIRPIWSRNALKVHMNQVSHGRLKQLLSLVAYYFFNGPWRTLWVKFGYDPRKNPGAKIYQMLDFRLGSRTEGKNLPIPRKRSFHRLSIPVLRKSSAKSEVKLVSTQGEDEEKADQQDDDLPYVFTANKLPMHKQMFYQLCDVHVAEVQELISVNDGQETECHDKEGWCIPGTLDKIRDIMVQHTLNLVEKIKTQREEEGKDSQDGSGLIEWDGHEEVKGFLEMLEGDDDIETYDIFDDESDDEPEQDEDNMSLDT